MDMQNSCPMDIDTDQGTNCKMLSRLFGMIRFFVHILLKELSVCYSQNFRKSAIPLHGQGWVTFPIDRKLVGFASAWYKCRNYIDWWLSTFCSNLLSAISKHRNSICESTIVLELQYGVSKPQWNHARRIVRQDYQLSWAHRFGFCVLHLQRV